jgi:hypothetical protein
VVVYPVAPFGRSVNGDVGDHPAIDELGLSEFPEQLDVLFVSQFVRWVSSMSRVS